MPYPVMLLLALLLTEAIEIPVCLLWGMRRRDLLFAALANVMTNPAVNVLYAVGCLYTKLPGAAILAVLETAAVLSEWLVFRSAVETKHPFLVSLTANAASFGAGLLITTFIL